MTRTEETISLIEKYIELSQGFQFVLSKLQRKYRDDLKEYLRRVKKDNSIDEEFYNTNVISNEDLRINISNELQQKKEELVPIFIRLWNLHQSNGSNQINSSDSHFKYLIENSKTHLTRLGFRIKDEQEGKLEHVNPNGIVISIVYQRYDPPEVWMKRLNDNRSIRIGSLTEQYFDGELKLYKKYAGLKLRYFNYSSFDYYNEFIELYLNKTVKIGDFVQKINSWIDEKFKNTAL